MKNRFYFRLLWLILVFSVLPPLAPAFAAPEEEFLLKDRDASGMGPLLNEYLNKIKSKRGIIIYSGCRDKYGFDIFVVSNALKQGLLLEFSDGKFANIAFVDLKDNGDIIIGVDGMMGGLWTRDRMQNNIDQIVKMPFHVFLGKSPAELFDVKFPGICEDFPEQ